MLAACANAATKLNQEKPNTDKPITDKQYPDKLATDTKQTNAIKLVPIKSSDASEFLNFAETYANLPIEAQKQELANTNQALTLNPNDLLHRMKLIMILGLPSSSLADTPKAQNLLQQVLQENILANTQLAYAHVLFDYLIAVNKVSKGNKDDQKRVDTLQQKNEILQQKLEAAQQKLDELKNIEKSMGARDSAPSNSKDNVPKK